MNRLSAICLTRVCQKDGFNVFSIMFLSSTTFFISCSWTILDYNQENITITKTKTKNQSIMEYSLIIYIACTGSKSVKQYMWWFFPIFPQNPTLNYVLRTSVEVWIPMLCKNYINHQKKLLCEISVSRLLIQVNMIKFW